MHASQGIFDGVYSVYNKLSDTLEIMTKNITVLWSLQCERLQVIVSLFLNSAEVIAQYFDN